MIAEEVFVNCYNFNFRVKHESINVKSRYQYSSQKRSFSRHLIKLSGAGAGAAIRICGFAGAERNIFGSTTLTVFKTVISILIGFNADPDTDLAY